MFVCFRFCLYVMKLKTNPSVNFLAPLFPHFHQKLEGLTFHYFNETFFVRKAKQLENYRSSQFKDLQMDLVGSEEIPNRGASTVWSPFLVSGTKWQTERQRKRNEHRQKILLGCCHLLWPLLPSFLLSPSKCIIKDKQRRNEECTWNNFIVRISNKETATNIQHWTYMKKWADGIRDKNCTRRTVTSHFSKHIWNGYIFFISFILLGGEGGGTDLPKWKMHIIWGYQIWATLQWTRSWLIFRLFQHFTSSLHDSELKPLHALFFDTVLLCSEWQCYNPFINKDSSLLPPLL